MNRLLQNDAFAPRLASFVAAGLAAICMIAQAGATPAAAGAEDELPRQSKSQHFPHDGRKAAAPANVSDDRHASLATDGERLPPHASAAAAGNPQAGSLRATAANDFWIYYADVQLFNDDDNDGYYHGIDVLLDADTLYEAADVYAVLYLSYEGGPWNEYAVTDDFTVFGATSDDEYVVVTELTSGYPTGSYDLLIELYDSFDGTFLAEFGPEDTSELSYLPIEDFYRDDPGHGHSVTVIDHGGGALDLWLVTGLSCSLLLASLLRRRVPAKRRRRDRSI